MENGQHRKIFKGQLALLVLLEQMEVMEKMAQMEKQLAMHLLQ